MQSCQFHSRSLVKGQSSIFARELRKYSKTWRPSPDEFPAISGRWDFNVKALQLRKIQELFELATKTATTFCTKCICLCLQTLLAISWTYRKAIFWNIYRAKLVQEHRNFRFTGIWDVSAEWGNLFCTVKTTCRKDAGLSAARRGMPIFPHLSWKIFRVFQKWFT